MEAWVCIVRYSFLYIYRLVTGKFLYDELNKRQDYEIVFVWNRTLDRIKDIVPDELILENLAECNKR